MAACARCLAATCLSPPFFCGCLCLTNVSTTAAPRAAVATRVPLEPSQSPGSLRSRSAAIAPASIAHCAASLHRLVLRSQLLLVLPVLLALLLRRSAPGRWDEVFRIAVGRWEGVFRAPAVREAFGG